MTSAGTTVSIIPRPTHVQMREGSFTISSATGVSFDRGNNAARRAADRLIETVARSSGIRIGTGGATSIRFSDPLDEAIGPEGYSLDITEAQITIRASDGFFNAVQTLLQLLPPHALSRAKQRQTQSSVPCLRITDAPRFAWRGLMLDVCRHFFSVDDVLRQIDVMALHKLNVLHLHLTDDHGWRVEIKKHPKLTQLGAWRDGIGFGLEPSFGKQMVDAEDRYGGFFTQDDCRRIVAYAAERNIAVVPEIEMPGHATAALVAYPELSCTGGPFKIPTRGGVFEDVYCAGNDAVFALLEDVLDEVLAIFPSTFIHVGGDECPKTRWKSCPKCQARIRDEKLKDEHELQSWFIRRMEKFLNARGRRLVGWDEILEGGLAPNATVMSWRGVAGGIAAAKAGHEVVMSPTTHCYLDYPQSEFGEPRAIGSMLTLDKVYAYDPIPPELSNEESRRVLGVQANLWTEFVPDVEHAEYMTWPRAAALAEVAWSGREGKDFGDFERRLDVHLRRLDAMVIDYRSQHDRCTISMDQNRDVHIAPAERGTRYTLDGTEPTRESPRYEAPIQLGPDVRLIRAAVLDARGGVGRSYADAFVVDGRLCRISAFIHGWQRHVLRHISFDGGRFSFDSHEKMSEGNHVTFIFDRMPRRLIHAVVVTTGDGENGRIEHGTLEASADGTRFTRIADFDNGTARGPMPIPDVTAIRVRATGASRSPIVVSSVHLA